MRPVCALLVYLGIVFLGGALLAPWAYWGAQAAAQKVAGLASLANEPLHRYVNRTWMIMGIIGLWPFLRASGMASWNDLGLGRVPQRWHQWSWGLALGFGSLAVVAGVGLALEARVFVTNRTISQCLVHLATASASAVVVACVEEIIFRGTLFGALRKSFRWETALVLSSAFYALVHFFQRPEAPETVDWISGLALLPRMMRGFGEVHQLFPGFLTLTVAGVFLGFAYQRTGNLFFSIGLHAGWIFWLKSYAFLTDEGKGASTWIWGSGKLTDGWFSFVVLTAAMLGCHRFCWRNLATASDERHTP